MCLNLEHIFAKITNVKEMSFEQNARMCEKIKTGYMADTDMRQPILICHLNTPLEHLQTMWAQK